MSLSWAQRKQRLQELLRSQGDEDEDGLTLDRLLHGQNVIGKTSRTAEIDSLRFQDRDLVVMGTLEYGSFGVIDVVTCRLDSRVYVRKSIEKRFALRTREQCSPQFERDILLQALKSNTCWAPHLLCAFHTETHLNFVMDYAEGGTLWDVLESSPLEGRISEDDLRWWTPQIVSAIHWCHSQGFAHRDIKPHNFVLTPTSHILLIDFGSAAPLLPPNKDGVQLVPKRFCIVPCGTCDYISPEILKAHEQALVALEMEEEGGQANETEDDVYGLETDWWSMGAMLYEMAYGIAPFFAEDIKRTYFKIMEHKRNLRFSHHIQISEEYQDFLRGLLTDAEFRLGRRNVMQITDHPFFDGTVWGNLSIQNAPSNLHLPQFSYSEPQVPMETSKQDTEEFSQPFAFSAFFQSSVAASSSPGLSIFHKSPSPNTPRADLSESTAASSFIGFSWGPSPDAFSASFDENTMSPRPLSSSTSSNIKTPRPFRAPTTWLTPGPSSIPQPQFSLLVPPSVSPSPSPYSTPGPRLHAYSTPIRGNTLVTPYHTQTLPRASTVRRTLPRRAVSDREAMRQLVDCVGMSARKKVLESGRKPRILPTFGTDGARDRSNSTTSGGRSTIRKELRFIPPSKSKGGIPPFPPLERATSSSSLRSQAQKQKASGDNGMSSSWGSSSANFNSNSNYLTVHGSKGSTDRWDFDSDSDNLDTSMDTDTSSEAPPSPSPSPRPGSAMSMVSMMSRRSATPTATATFSQLIGGNTSSRHLTPHSHSGTGFHTGTNPIVRNRSNSNGSGQGPTISSVTHPSRGSLRFESLTMMKEAVAGEEAGEEAGAGAAAGRGVSEDHDILEHGHRHHHHPISKITHTRSSSKDDGSELGFLTTLDDSTFDELEMKHASIMDDISLLETRLGRFSKLMGKDSMRRTGTGVMDRRSS
ncbi:hypothetical protein D9758_008628 [Tetrapyrgos nigripes]|uniref:Protein kinase domain-containing protein n=1 Tax=Tetrapyrgos nigripes TaxID=182062 RepID=A0A8H5D4V6_9AGAR|nr:hypothetical protein D9758_008628 [Tetrapyrgos nigripes]